LQTALPEEDGKAISLDAAMAFVRKPTLGG
jgi:hypothetical protein